MALVKTLHELTPTAQTKLEAATRSRAARVKQARDAIKATLTGRRPEPTAKRHGRHEDVERITAEMRAAERAKSDDKGKPKAEKPAS